MDFDNLVQSRD